MPRAGGYLDEHEREEVVREGVKEGEMGEMWLGSAFVDG